MRRLLPLITALLLACADPTGSSPAPSEAGLAEAREKMIEEQVRRMVGEDERVLGAFRKVPRHRFLPEEMWDRAYADGALKRPDGETLTAADLSAGILSSLELSGDSRVLECGTRSGWLTALMATLAAEVCTVDARAESGRRAQALLDELGLENIRFRIGDPIEGWPDAGPFDAIILNGVVEHIPRELYRSLKPGGRILAPVGRPGEPQSLILSVRGEETPRKTRPVLTVRFGPLQR